VEVNCFEVEVVVKPAVEACKQSRAAEVDGRKGKLKG
jgi:hypothetical protein